MSTQKHSKVINLKNCKHQILKNVASLYSLQIDEENDANLIKDGWDIWWMDSPNCCQRDTMKAMGAHQCINHFVAMTELGIKSHLARNLNRMNQLFPEEYNFHPKTFVLPKEYKKLLDYLTESNNQEETPSSTLIVKPYNNCEGRGIFVESCKQLLQEMQQNEMKKQQQSDLQATDPNTMSGMFSRENWMNANCVVQEYLSNPLLLDGFKFDLRLYVTIPSSDPIRIYLHKDGLVRLATDPYEVPTSKNYSNVHMHLTNYTINKLSQNYYASDDNNVSENNNTNIEDNNNNNKHNDTNNNNAKDESVKGTSIHTVHKRTFSWLLNHIRQTKGNECAETLIDNIIDVVAKTVIAVQPTLASLNTACFPSHCQSPAFELLGFDILIDQNMKVWIEEVNQSPSLSTDTPVDLAVKHQMLCDVFRLLNFGQAPKVSQDTTNTNNPSSITPMPSSIQVSSGFWKVFPTQKSSVKYQKLFCFPFPQEMLQMDEGNTWLDKSEISSLLSILNIKKQP